MISKHLFVLLACLFVVMIGFGITLPVLPFYVERLALEAGASRQSIVLHVTLLTGVYALMQLIFAPLWGRWSDRIGRRPLILIGIAGYVIAQVMFGLSTSLWLLYAARIVGGILSSATLPVSAAYVVDMTTKEERGRGMAWLGTAVSLGVVVGPALGGLLSRRDWHFNWSAGHFKVDAFSTPFFAAALLGLLTLLAAWRWLPESMPKTSAQNTNPAKDTSEDAKTDWRTLVKTLSPLLALTLAGQFALTMFEGTFALFAQAKFDYRSRRSGIRLRGVRAGDDGFSGRCGRFSRRKNQRDDSDRRGLRLDGNGHRVAGDGADEVLCFCLCRAARIRDGVHRSESRGAHFKARRRATGGRVARHPECRQQSRSSGRTASWAACFSSGRQTRRIC